MLSAPGRCIARCSARAGPHCTHTSPNRNFEHSCVFVFVIILSLSSRELNSSFVVNALANLACLSEYFHLVCVLELWPQFGCSKVVGSTSSSLVSKSTSTRALLRSMVTEVVRSIAATASAFRIVILVNIGHLHFDFWIFIETF